MALWAGSGDPAPPALLVRTDPPAPLSGAVAMAPYAGRTVEARGVRVLSLAGEGFWVGSSDADRVFVERDGRADPSRRLTMGARVSFVGRLVANTAQHLVELGVTAPADEAQLRSQGHHVDVAAPALRVG